MKYLIYGAGTIGVSYAWLLSRKHDVDIFVKSEHLQNTENNISFSVKDLRKKELMYQTFTFKPNYITEVTERYDGILVAVNRCQLQTALPYLSQLKKNTGWFAFMQNNWNIEADLVKFFNKNEYIIAFPSNIGGGREKQQFEVIIFDEAARIGGENCSNVASIKKGFEEVSIKTVIDDNILDWLKVHYLQQSITAGAILENRDFVTFSHNYDSVKKMVKAFREGIAVCHIHGVPTRKIFPAPLFKLPIFIVAHVMQKMFLDQNTIEMVSNHMKQGLPEWIAGYKEVLKDGLEQNLPMTVWKSYDKIVDKYIEKNN